ncbi:KPN_02809 family neutral zinc metallopeptidase [Leeia aquatica]|uniref:Zinc metallopeptidase n=1 Tax=Leeia aquatica TaxID=2725557 RepID=A0A847S6Q4_9NEIS|nr:neutral zinc metallopeptidase [Leeia aquatica]NLR75564.1 zinc metallopeptidase [Leeia aquatica]
MRWDDLRRSDNVEDRRGDSSWGGGGSGGGFSGFGGFRLSGTGLIILVVVSLILGKNPLTLLNMLNGHGSGSRYSQQQQQRPAAPPPQSDRSAQFVRAILGNTEDFWGKWFQQRGQTYPQPHLVLFRGSVQSACGRASSAVGPFYCSGDQKVFIDLSFFDELHQRFGAPGDFAQAYVIAHEVGHHVQNVIGVTRQVVQQGEGLSERERNALSVRQELQADCFAGVWGHYAQQQGLLDGGDLGEALTAANAIGDDTLQQEAQGHVTPDAFTHGTAKQRKRWFSIGFERGDPERCDTFSATRL